MPFPWDSAVLAAPGAKEIPPHIKHSWGGLLTWILLSVSWLQPPLLPNSTWPRWFLPQTERGNQSISQSGQRPPGEKPTWGMFGMADAVYVHCTDWESESQRGEEVYPNVSSVPQWDFNLIPSSELILGRVPKRYHQSYSLYVDSLSLQNVPVPVYICYLNNTFSTQSQFIRGAGFQQRTQIASSVLLYYKNKIVTNENIQRNYFCHPILITIHLFTFVSL